MHNKLYLLIEPNLPTYDKIMDKDSVFEFVCDNIDSEDKKLLKEIYEKDCFCERNSLTKDNESYFDELLKRYLDTMGYILFINDKGIINIEDYQNLLGDICPDRFDVKKLFAE